MVSSQRTQLLRREDEGLKENVLVIADLCQIPPLEANYSFYICGLGLSVSPWKSERRNCQLHAKSGDDAATVERLA